MSAETVTTKIEEKARISAEAIIAEAKEKAEAERKAILDDAKLRADKLLDNAKLNAEIAEKGRAQSDAMNIKLGILAQKREILSDVMQKAKDGLKNLNDNKLIDIFKKYVSSSELEGSYELLPSPLHRDFCKKAISEFEKCADIKLTLSEKDANLSSGFMLSCENYDVEFSLDAILNDVFEQNEKEISNILFETGDVK